MSRQTRVIALTVLAATLLASRGVADPQNPPEPPIQAGTSEPTGGMGGIGLLRLERVQQELKLTDAQNAKLQEFLDGLRNELREQTRVLKDLPPEQRRQKWEELEQELRSQAPQRTARIAREIAAILQPEQLKRFREIELRQDGPWVLLRQDVVGALELTDAQKEQLRQISRETENRMRDVFRETSTSNERNGQQVRQLQVSVEQERREGQKRAAAVLTLDQKKKLLELMGGPLERNHLGFSPHRAAPKNPATKDTPPGP